MMKLFLARRILRTLLVGFICLAAFSAVHAAGEVDPGFLASAYGSVNGPVQVIKRQPDGKILVGGNFFDVNGVAATGLGRLNADLTVDTTFNPPDFGNGQGLGGTIYAIALQSDGKIIVGGEIFGVDGVFNPGLKRLLPNGALDPTFQAPQDPQFFIYRDIEILPGDKFLANSRRFNADGSVDNSYSDIFAATEFGLQADGKILAATGGAVSFYRRYKPDGSVDTVFSEATTNGLIYAIVALPDGKSIIGGNFTAVNGFPAGRIARINSDGTRDFTFNQNMIGFDETVADIKPTSDGKLAVTGSFGFYNGAASNRAALLNADGSRDASFHSAVPATGHFANGLEILPDGRWLVGFNPNAVLNTLLLLNSNGTIDNSLNAVVSRGGLVTNITQQADGKILMVGSFQYSNGAIRRSVARLNLNGGLDASFVPYFTENFYFNTVAVQPDGKILLGAFTGPALTRLNSDGSQDTGFTPVLPDQLNVHDLAVQPDGKILVGAALGTSNGTVRRLNPDGSNDPAFTAPVFNGAVRTIALQPDGKIMVGGAFTQLGAVVRGRVARLNADGTLDNSFNPPGGTNGEVVDMQLLPDGKIAIAGEFGNVNGFNGFNKVAKLNPDGSVNFDFQQHLQINGVIGALHVEPDGKVILGGSIVTVGNTPKAGLAKFDANGTLDPTFNTTVNFQGYAGVQDIFRQPDGKLLIGGGFTKVNGVSRVRIARLLNNTAAPRHAPFDFDGDGKADIAVFRAPENKWYILQSSNSAVREYFFGAAGDIPVPADYDGDGKTDIAVYRGGGWHYVSSLNQNFPTVVFGQPGDIPRPSDFDGDGKADFIVFRPSNSVWYRYSSAGLTSIVAFGAAGDKPLIGDFDGDGKSDPAIFRPSTGDWWYAASSNNQFAVVHWGAQGDIPSPADVDADGKTDFVVYRPSNGGWYILRSGEQNYTILQFGLPEDKPVMADYDGDGKADVAVFRPSTGVWYLYQTTAGVGAVQWGNFTDTPTPNAFLP